MWRAACPGASCRGHPVRAGDQVDGFKITQDALVRAIAGDWGRPFRYLWGGASAAFVGSQLGRFALPLLAASLTTSPVAISIVALALSAPWLVIGLPAGAIVDRARPADDPALGQLVHGSRFPGAGRGGRDRERRPLPLLYFAAVAPRDRRCLRGNNRPSSWRRWSCRPRRSTAPMPGFMVRRRWRKWSWRHSAASWPGSPWVGRWALGGLVRWSGPRACGHAGPVPAGRRSPAPSRRRHRRRAALPLASTGCSAPSP